MEAKKYGQTALISLGRVKMGATAPVANKATAALVKN